VTISFIGSTIQYIGERNNDLGNMEVYVDGVDEGTVSAYTSGSRQAQQVLYQSPLLAFGQH